MPPHGAIDTTRSGRFRPPARGNDGGGPEPAEGQVTTIVTWIVAACATALLGEVTRRIVAVAAVSVAEQTMGFGPVVTPAPRPQDLVIDLDQREHRPATLSPAA